jgi:hypothetical protein
MSEQRPSDSDLILPFERQAIPVHYRPYYVAKRNNFFASLQSATGLWRHFQLLDRNLLNEFEDMGTARDADGLALANTSKRGLEDQGNSPFQVAR